MDLEEELERGRRDERARNQPTRTSEHFAHEYTGLSEGSWWRSSRDSVVVDPLGLRRSELATSRRVAVCAEIGGDADEEVEEAEVKVEAEGRWLDIVAGFRAGRWREDEYSD